MKKDFKGLSEISKLIRVKVGVEIRIAIFSEVQ